MCSHLHLCWKERQRQKKRGGKKRTEIKTEWSQTYINVGPHGFQRLSEKMKLWQSESGVMEIKEKAIFSDSQADRSKERDSVSRVRQGRVGD